MPQLLIDDSSARAKQNHALMTEGRAVTLAITNLDHVRKAARGIVAATAVNPKESIIDRVPIAARGIVATAVDPEEGILDRAPKAVKVVSAVKVKEGIHDHVPQAVKSNEQITLGFVRLKEILHA